MIGLSIAQHKCRSNLDTHGSWRKVNGRRRGGQIPLMPLAASENPEPIEALIAAGAGADTNSAKGLSVLMLSAGFDRNPHIIARRWR